MPPLFQFCGKITVSALLRSLRKFLHVTSAWWGKALSVAVVWFANIGCVGRRYRRVDRDDSGIRDLFGALFGLSS